MRKYKTLLFNISLVTFTVLSTIIYINNYNSLQYSYYFLSYLTFASLLTWIFYYKKLEWVKDIAFNFLFLFLGILIVAFLIDRIIERNNEIERKKYEYIALSHLRIPILNHTNFLFNLYKASTIQIPEKKIITVEDLFTEDYFIQLSFLDFSKPAPIFPSIEYSEYCFNESNKFIESISNSLEKYSIYLPSNTVEKMESIINSSFLMFMKQIYSIRKIDNQEGFKRKYNFFADSGLNSLAKNYAEIFKNLVNNVNDKLSSDKKIKINPDKSWRDDMAPKLGSGRID